jgi:phosphoribosylformylglycinamidine synthase subunit PurL
MMAIADLMKGREVPFKLFDIDIFSATDNEMVELSHSLGLSLSLEEMFSVREYFRAKRRKPTDVELQSIAQAWSEHCCYKSSRVFLKENVFGISSPDQLAKGDAGVMAFDEEYAYALRIESHNHPSAIEPYGGAATGIGGIIRDVTCMGAQPVALIDPLFFGSLEYEGELPAGVKHPKYLLGGVVAGIRDYGNRIGIPTVSGGVYFDDGYTGNCLVNVGCVGIVKREHLIRNAVGGIEDLLILVGGRTGRDGIHGVTFASAELDERSEEESRGAVQLGDPIMKEPLMHACLEVSSRGLLSGMKDLGGGGLSCVVGEMALAAGYGAEVHLDRVPLKERGLAPWEIWVSESQERMMLAAKEANLEAIMEVFDLWDVRATVIGRVTRGKEVTLYFHGEKIFEMELDFLTTGPEYCRPYQTVSLGWSGEEVSPHLPDDLSQALLSLLSDPNIASKEWVIRQYDHEVRGNTVIKPLQGKLGKRCHGDAAVIKPLEHSMRGLAISIGVNPWFTTLDPYRGGQSAVDEACRNIVSVGGRPHSLSDCLNFGNPEKPERLGEFREAVRGLGQVAGGLGLPIPSGNVSLYNETPYGPVPPTPTVMGVGIVENIGRCVTSDLKVGANPLYLVGTTRGEMGGSCLYRRFGGSGGQVPGVRVEELRVSMDRLIKAMEMGMIRACHDCSDGGLAVTIAEMCMGGDIGCHVDLDPMEGMETARKLFCESNSRWVVEVDASMEDDWKECCPSIRLGEVGGDTLTMTGPGEVINLPVQEMREAWSSPLWRMLG